MCLHMIWLEHWIYVREEAEDKGSIGSFLNMDNLDNLG